MSSVLQLTYPKNISPDSDGEILVAALYEAVEVFGGAEKFARTLISGAVGQNERKAA